MEVILKENVQKLGKAGDVVKVADGYARNFLLPQSKAIAVTEKNIQTIQEQLKKKQAKKKEEEIKLNETVEKLSEVEVTIKKLASEDDKLFGSVSESDIAEELSKQGVEVEKGSIVLEKHIKELGVFKVPVKFKQGAEAKIKVWVVRDDEKKDN